LEQVLLTTSLENALDAINRQRPQERDIGMDTAIILGQLGLAFAAFVVIFRAMVTRLEGLGLIRAVDRTLRSFPEEAAKKRPLLSPSADRRR
jgi:hypothetical protein